LLYKIKTIHGIKVQLPEVPRASSWELAVESFAESTVINDGRAFSFQTCLNTMHTRSWQILSPVAGFGILYKFKFNDFDACMLLGQTLSLPLLSSTGVQLRAYNLEGH
jgi:hypothetical protein